MTRQAVTTRRAPRPRSGRTARRSPCRATCLLLRPDRLDPATGARRGPSRPRPSGAAQPRGGARRRRRDVRRRRQDHDLPRRYRTTSRRSTPSTPGSCPIRRPLAPRSRSPPCPRAPRRDRGHRAPAADRSRAARPFDAPAGRPYHPATDPMTPPTPPVGLRMQRGRGLPRAPDAAHEPSKSRPCGSP